MCYELIVVLAVAGLLPGIWIVTKLIRWMGHLAIIERTVGRSEYGVERTRSRIQLLSIRTNVLALVLISLVGLLTVSLEAYRTFWQDKSLSSVGLEELLRSKLPDPEVQAQRHREIVDTISNARPIDRPSLLDEEWRQRLNDLEARVTQLTRQLDDGKTQVSVISGPQTSSSLSVASILTVLALFAGPCLIGGLFYFLMRKRHKMIGAAAAATSLAIGSVLSGTTLFKDLTVFKQLDIKFERGESRPVTPPPPTDVHVDFNLRMLEPSSATVECAHHVGPFIDGDAVLGGEERKQLDGVIVDIAKKAERVIAVMLVGAADKRSLTPKTAKSFNSNQGLAQARIEFVQSELKPVLGTKGFIKSYRGPTKTDEKASSDDLKEDRSVEICLILKSDK